jgi:hypothetical protein
MTGGCPSPAGGWPPPAGFGAFPPDGLGTFPPVPLVSSGSIGGPVGTGCAWIRWRGWSGLGAIAGAEPIPNKPGRIAGTMTDVTRVNKMMAVTMTALGAAIPAGWVRAAVTTDREVACMTRSSFLLRVRG